MNDETLFTSIDSITAEAVLESLSSNDADLYALFCYLCASFRQGYLFVEPGSPALNEICEDVSQEGLEEAISRGFTKVRALDRPSPYFVFENARLYVTRAKMLLELTEQLYKKLAGTPARLMLDLVALEKELASLQAAKKLLPEQASAIRQASSTTLSCIWGGPGTGKTYTAGWLVSLFLKQHPKAKIALAAPTGKATANLQMSIQKTVESSLQGSFEAKTLHSLLGIRRLGQKRKNEELGFDLILVDESSMIDLELAYKLFSQVAPGARLVFLGDPYQLPPVEPGEPFCALVNEKMRQSDKGFLIMSKRQDEGAILKLAQAVKDGLVEEALFILQNDPSSSVQWSRDAKAMEREIEHVKSLYIAASKTIAGLFLQLNRLRLLCPLREGREGLLAINQKIMRAMKESSCEPIMITKNDFHLELTNGQVGLLCGDRAYFEDQEAKSGIRSIPKVLLPAFETAFCLSVHKSQGSEFDEVVLFLPEGSERFGKKMLYTAITRAKKRFRIIGSEDVLRRCIANEGRKVTTFFTLC